MKTCSKCKVEKAFVEFCKKTTRGKVGLNPICNICNRQRVKEWQIIHRATYTPSTPIGYFTCKFCKETKVAPRYKSKNRVYCSQECQSNSQKTKTVVNCFMCGVEMLRKPSDIKKYNKLYCSTKCNHKSKELGGKWSKEYDSCIRCKTTKYHYNGFGLCNSCGGKNRDLIKNFGIDVWQYDAMLKKQDGKCAMKSCGVQLEGQGMNLAVDHDHSTGKIRGLLCRMCNLGLGNFRDNPQVLQSAIEYLTLHQQPDKVGLWLETQKDNTLKQIPPIGSGIRSEKQIPAGFGQELLTLRDTA